MAVNNREVDSAGVRGWLLILCLSLTIFDPVAIVITLFVVTDATKSYFGEHPEFFKLILISGVCRLGLAVFSVYAGIALWKVLPGAVITARRYLRAMMLYSVAVVFLPAMVGVPQDSYQELAGQTMFNSLMTIAYAAAWYLYLKRSKRVRATYGKAE